MQAADEKLIINKLGATRTIIIIIIIIIMIIIIVIIGYNEATYS